MNHKFGLASHSEQDSSQTNFAQPRWGRPDAFEVSGERSTPIPRDLLGGGFSTVTDDVSIGGSDNANVSKEIKVAAVSLSDGTCGHSQQYPQHASSTVPQAVGEYVVPPPHMELVGHSIACAPYPYSAPYYRGLIPAQGPNSMAQSHIFGPQLTRMALPIEMAEEPVYVNAKQYHGIIRRRQIRAKAELERKVIKTRKPYLHESRHLHAMKRARGSGGRFLSTKKLENAGHDNTPNKGTSGSTVSVASGSRNFKRSEDLPFKCTGSASPSTTQQETYQTTWHNMLQNPEFVIDNNINDDLHLHKFQIASYNSLSDDKGGASSRQKHERVVNRSFHRALTIK